MELRHYPVVGSKPAIEIVPSINGKIVEEFVQLCSVDKNSTEELNPSIAEG